jgi:hypothetical protein
MPGYLTRPACTVLVSAAVEEQDRSTRLIRSSRGSLPELLCSAARRRAISNPGVYPCR